MANRVSAATKEGIHSLFQWGAMGHWSDEQLIAQFVLGQDASEAAFRVLIHRHGPMVLAVCRRVLGDEHAAEDAFQATFLVLVKKAPALRDCGLLSNWLHGVALRVASKDRVNRARRRVIEQQAAAGSVIFRDGEPGQAELKAVIDAEIRRLPERYRTPLVLCHVEGLRHEEVAHRLGCPVGTVESRLSRAREQLRTRLARRGLAPSASVMIAALRPPPGIKAMAPSLVEMTLRAAAESTSRQALAKTGFTATGWMSRTFALVPAFQPGRTVLSLVACLGLSAMGLTMYRAAGEPAPVPISPVLPPPQSSRPSPATAAGARISNATVQEKQQVIIAPEPVPEARRVAEKTQEVAPKRFPSAMAIPLTNITIDGRLDDWPKTMTTYAIGNQLLEHQSYQTEPVELADDPRAYFMVGYSEVAQQIYVAVVVRDKDIVVHPTDTLQTDAVEIYIDGNFSNSATAVPSGDWQTELDAATMPVLQYAGVPGRLRAYGDRWNANPSLVYAGTRQTATTMKYQYDGNVITYEWSVKAFDRYPDRPTRLHVGKHLGFDVAVLDKDKLTAPEKPLAALREKRPTVFLTWGLPPEVFKGCDARSLGELILTNGPTD